MDNSIIRSAVVNGSLGAVGSALVRHLVAQGIRTYAIIYPEANYQQILPSEAVIIPCDMRQIHNLKQIINEQVDAFFHLAWMGTIGPDRNNMAVQIENVRCAVEAVNAAEQLGCKVFVGTGSQAECGRVEGKIKPDTPCFPENGYGIAKLCAGQMTRLECQKRKIRHVWARILSIYGPNDGVLSLFPSMMKKLLLNEKPSLTAGEQLWDFLYADDAAHALLCMALSGKDGMVYPVGSGKCMPLREYFFILRDVIDPSLPLGIGDIPYAQNQVMHLEADIQPLQTDTGFSPRFSFEEGIKKTLQHYVEKENL